MKNDKLFELDPSKGLPKTFFSLLMIVVGLVCTAKRRYDMYEFYFNSSRKLYILVHPVNKIQ